MEQKNKQIIYEYLLLNKSFQESLQRMRMGNNDGYSWYNDNMKDWFGSLCSQYANALGIQNIQSEEEVILVCSNMELTAEQKIALKKIQREPVFKKLMGEAALSKKEELESLLGQTLTEKGMTYADENGARVSVKSFPELDKEWDACNDKLDNLLSNGTISEEQWRNYAQQLDYIYGYYMSISKGEQIPFRKISDVEIKAIEDRAQEEGIDFYALLTQINSEKKEDFQDFHESTHKGR